MTKPLDLTGQRFGLLTVLSRAPFNNSQGGSMWICACDCGGDITAWAQNIKGGKTSSCGCVRVQHLTNLNKKRLTTHGKSKSNEYKIWAGINDRCNNPNSADFTNYQGRGITLCERWRSFENFLADMGPRPSKKHSVDRIDNDKGYAPDNCRWASPQEQQNNRRDNVFITLNGVTKTITEWARHHSLTPGSVFARYRKGLRGHELFKPVLNRDRKLSAHRAGILHR